VAGERFRLEVTERTHLGSPESRRMRKRGLVPGVLYGKSATRAIAIEERALRSALTGSSGLHAVLDVVIEGQTTTHPSILKEYQRDPIRGHVRHVDLQEVRLDQPIQAAIQVHIVGAENAPGVREGGVMSTPTTEINIEALPMEVPESIEVDVSNMSMGDTLRLETVPPIEGVTFLDDLQDTVIATVTAPMREIEPELTEEELAEAAEAEAGEEGAPEGAAEAGEAAGEPGTDEG
jgi:large subunit ribosomal protein L25